MKDHFLPTYTCPNCHKVLDGHTGITDDEPPKLGDLSVCLYCQSFLEYGKNGFVLLTDDAVKQLSAEVSFELHRVKQAILAHGRFRKQPPQSITCPRCGRTSYNLNDVREKYCGFCHAWHEG